MSEEAEKPRHVLTEPKEGYRMAMDDVRITGMGITDFIFLWQPLASLN